MVSKNPLRVQCKICHVVLNSITGLLISDASYPARQSEDRKKVLRGFRKLVSLAVILSSPFLKLFSMGIRFSPEMHGVGTKVHN